MQIADIQPGRTYKGGKHGEKRTVTAWGATYNHVVWTETHTRLPYGGFIHTRCTSTASFAKWATEEVPK